MRVNAMNHATRAYEGAPIDDLSHVKLESVTGVIVQVIERSDGEVEISLDPRGTEYVHRLTILEAAIHPAQVRVKVTGLDMRDDGKAMVKAATTEVANMAFRMRHWTDWTKEKVVGGLEELQAFLEKAR